MSILLVGGDFLGDMVERMMGKGVTRVTHWSGRKPRMALKEIPEGTDVVVVFTDYVNHLMAKAVKTKCKKIGCPVLFSRRAWSDLESALESFNKCAGCDGCNCGKKFN